MCTHYNSMPTDRNSSAGRRHTTNDPNLLGGWKKITGTHMKKMKLVLALALAAVVLPWAAHAYVWTSCAQYGTYSSGGYEFYCDEWGSTASECCNLNSVTSWNVVSSVPTGGGVKGYPNTARNNIGKTVSAYTSSSSYNWSAPGGTYWDASFDCWVPTEVMVWEGNSGGVGPSGSKVYSNQSIDGATWNVTGRVAVHCPSSAPATQDQDRNTWARSSAGGPARAISAVVATLAGSASDSKSSDRAVRILGT